jgi:transposase
MRQNSERRATPDQIVKDIRRATRKHNSSEENTWVVLEGLRSEYSIAALCRRELIAWSLQHSWSKEFLEAGKKRLAGGYSPCSDEWRSHGSLP